MTRILVVEDDPHLAEGLAYNLDREGYDVQHVAQGAAALQHLEAHAADLVILDLMLPDMAGFRVLEQMRARGDTTPVIILSAREAETDKVRGFDAGANDYMTKPFGLGELLARIRVRLGASTPAARTFVLGEARVDLDTHIVSWGSEERHLTPTEVEILTVLWERREQPVDRDDLMRLIWGSGPTTSRTLDAHVTRLRKKIETDPGTPRYLVTVHGVGYRLTLR